MSPSSILRCRGASPVDRRHVQRPISEWNQCARRARSGQRAVQRVRTAGSATINGRYPTRGPTMHSVLRLPRLTMQTVYQFEVYNIGTDGYQKSRRWGTSDGIQQARGKIVGAGVDVDDDAIKIDGLTALNFDPHRSKVSGLQRRN